MRSMSAALSAAPLPGMSSWIEAPASLISRLLSNSRPRLTSTERSPTGRRSTC